MSFARSWSVGDVDGGHGALLAGHDERPSVSPNPLFGRYKTADGRWLAFSLAAAGRYFEGFCKHLGRNGSDHGREILHCGSSFGERCGLC